MRTKWPVDLGVDPAFAQQTMAYLPALAARRLTAEWREASVESAATASQVAPGANDEEIDDETDDMGGEFGDAPVSEATKQAEPVVEGTIANPVPEDTKPVDIVISPDTIEEYAAEAGGVVVPDQGPAKMLPTTDLEFVWFLAFNEIKVSDALVSLGVSRKSLVGIKSPTVAVRLFMQDKPDRRAPEMAAEVLQVLGKTAKVGEWRKR
jgi:hypothetical protein